MKHIKLLSLITLSSLLVGCSVISQKTNNSASDEAKISQEQSKKVTSMSFYNYITQSDKPVILYKISTDRFSFDNSPSRIYVFSEKGNFVYELINLKLGELSEMSDDDIINELDAKIPLSQELVNLIGAREGYIREKEEYESFNETFKMSFTEYFQYRFNGELRITDEELLDEYVEKYNNGDFAYIYEITDFDTGTRYLDDSGNTVLSREYDYEKNQIIEAENTDFYTIIDSGTLDAYVSTKGDTSDSVRLKNPFEGVIYDSTYKGSEDRKSDYYYVFRTDVDITIDTE